MPPPPMPANSPRQTPAVGSTGSGRAGGQLGFPRLPLRIGVRRGRRRRPAVTKLGQKPFRQDRSTLQLVGLMRRLRPSSVSTGSMAMQSDWAEQSPQFSQTASLITTCAGGCAIVPRLRRRRFSVAQT